MSAAIAQLLISSVVTGIATRGVMTAEEDIIIKWIIWTKIFSSTPFFKQYPDYYFNYGTRFDSAYSIGNLPRIKDGEHIINRYEKRSKGTLWITYLLTEIRLYMSTFLGLNIFHKKYETKSNIDRKIFRIQFDNSMYGFYCTAFR